MTSDELDSAAPPRRGRASKRAAIMRAARLVFGRDGYSRSSIDAIAGEAAVSTRTIYNHFAGKDELFNAVLRASAGQVADSFVDALDRGLPGGPAGSGQLEADLVVIGRALLAQSHDNPEHFAVVRQISVEAAHVPPQVLQGWREAGPLRVRRVVADRLRGFADQGLLRVQDPVRAAGHLVALCASEVAPAYTPWAAPLTGEQLDDAITAAVRAFLNGYAGVSEPTAPGAAATG